MSKFRDLYKRNGLTESNRAEQRTNTLNRNRKIKRSEALDLARNNNNKATANSQDSKSEQRLKNTMKENKRRPMKKKQQQQKQPVNYARLPPFVVGIVRHEIHSPPFLHGPLHYKHKKNNSTTSLQPIASKSYKFKPPKELTINDNYMPPKIETKKLITLSNSNNKIDTEPKNFPNVDTRIPKEKFGNNLSFGSDSEESEIGNKKINYDSVKKVLWSEDIKEEPICDQLNVLEATQKSDADLCKENNNSTDDESRPDLRLSSHSNEHEIKECKRSSSTSKPCKNIKLEQSSEEITNRNDVLEICENEVVDLVSADEEDYTSFLSKLLTRCKDTSPSLTLNKSASPSIENIPRIESPKIQLNTPLRVLSLRNRTISISPMITPLRERKRKNNSFNN